jgi:uncharacterized repeat protein (TIGR02543 family)
MNIIKKMAAGLGAALAAALLFAACPQPGQPEQEQDSRLTVTFDSQGGSAVAPAKVESGQPVAQPVNPTKTDSVFGDWRADSGLTAQWNFATPVTADMTLYARWIAAANAYTIRFNTNGGSAIPDINAEVGQVISPPPPPRKQVVFFTDGVRMLL